MRITINFFLVPGNPTLNLRVRDRQNTPHCTFKSLPCFWPFYHFHFTFHRLIIHLVKSGQRKYSHLREPDEDSLVIAVVLVAKRIYAIPVLQASSSVPCSE